MALSGIEASAVGDLPRARALAERLGLPLVDRSSRGKEGVRLGVKAVGLYLAFEDHARGKPLTVDLTRAVPRPPLARAHIFRRALGRGETLIDATAGLGTDAVRATSLGFNVTAVERSPVLFEILNDALARASDQAEFATSAARLNLHCGDAKEFLARTKADVVYLDPMFTKLKASAKSPKEMQMLQEILNHEDDHGDALLAAALGAARLRVVMKRALKARPLGKTPSHSLLGQSVRYDVFVVH